LIEPLNDKLKILVVAPHPFFQERGTPIACKLLCESLSNFGHDIELLTYAEGESVEVPNLKTHRVWDFFFYRNMSIGLSVKKLLCDFFLAIRLFLLLSTKRYDVVHAGEESIFLALFFRFIQPTAVVYDMDSSMADQIIEKDDRFDSLHDILIEFERHAFRESDFIFPVCPALTYRFEQQKIRTPYQLLQDIYFESESLSNELDDLRSDIDENTQLLLYIGNLEPYQGIDLLLDSLNLLKGSSIRTKWILKVIGGKHEDIQHYRSMVLREGLEGHVKFLGKRPVADLNSYLKQANILLSPRTKGINTPMKVYSYLASGKPVVATNILSHSQAFTNDVALLVNPIPEAMATALTALIEDPERQQRIGLSGAKFAEENYSLTAYCRKLKSGYKKILSLKNTQQIV